MSWTEDEIDELLVRYLDQELSLDELKRFEETLAAEPAIQRKLSAWRELRQGLQNLHIQAGNLELGPAFANRVIQAARIRVEESGNPQLAPWIARNSVEPTLAVASQLPYRDSGTKPASKHSPRLRTWLWGVAVSGIAASLLAIAFWPPLKPVANILLTENMPIDHPNPLVVLELQESQSPRSNNVVIDVPLPDQATPKIASDNHSNVLPDAQILPLETMAAKDSQRNNNRLSNSTKRSSDTSASTTAVTPSLEPTSEQRQMLEGMLTNPNGAFLFVVDVSLPDEVTDLDALRRVLDRYDIAWASQMEIDESMQSNLAQSRMIAEAGKRGLIPDFDQPKVAPDDLGKVTGNEVVSLIFVKARGSRLDAALIEIMRRVDEFPLFSFDLAFDAPTQTLMNELRFIQEASLPTTDRLDSQGVSSRIRRSGEGAEDLSLEHFGAGPRRSKEMSIETRRQSKMPLDSETMNPISYALFIVRHSSRDDVK